MVVVKSTVPVGTNDKVEHFIHDFLVNDMKVEVASNLELLAQGFAVRDTLHAERTIIGTESKWAEERLMKIYDPFRLPVVSVNRRSAEMIKYASNDFLALKISYMNDIANLCEFVGSCFPKDTKALENSARQNDYELRTVKAAIDVNKDQKTMLYKKARKRLITFNSHKVAVLGLTFKPGTDDLREAASLENFPLLLEQGADIYAYDPAGVANFSRVYPKGKNGKGIMTYVENLEGALEGANVCFTLLNGEKLKQWRLTLIRS